VLPSAEPSRLLSRLRAGEFLVTVELDPPRGHNIEKLVQGAKLLAERGVEVVDINDGSLGRLRMAVLPTAMLVREATGLDINMHFTCRDRNLMGIQADLLGAHALGIRNILAMTGDPPRAGDYVNATAVFDVDAVGLVRIIAGMNRGVDATGNSIGEPTAFGVGVAVDPGAADRGREIDRLHATTRSRSGSRPRRRRSSTSAGGTRGPTSCRRSGGSRWWRRCSRPSDDRPPGPRLAMRLDPRPPAWPACPMTPARRRRGGGRAPRPAPGRVPARDA
jgi:hypothetical protein